MLNLNSSPEIKYELNRVLGLNKSMVDQMHEIVWSMDETKDDINNFCLDLKTIFNKFKNDHNLQGQFIYSGNYNNLKINGFIRRNIMMCFKCIKSKNKIGLIIFQTQLRQNR